MKKYTFFAFIFIIHCSFFITHCSAQWYQINLPVSGMVNDMQFINANTGWAVVKQSSYIYTLIKTTNQGTNWDVIYSDSEKVMNIQFFNDTLGYAIGFQYVTSLILKTTNGGYNWATVQSSGSYVYGNMNFINRDTGWVSAFLDGFPNQYVCVFQTVNGLQNINLLYSNQGSLSGTKLKFFNNSINGQYFGYHLNQGKLYKTTNSGSNWTQINTGFTGNVNSFSFINKDTGWAEVGYPYGKILKTLNGSQNWIMQFNDTNNQYEPQYVFAVNENKIWCGTSSNYIFATNNGGIIWGKQNSQIAYPTKIYMVDTSLGFSWNPAQIQRTTNGGGPIMSVEKISDIMPSKIVLKQNYPNPFNSSTNIEFGLNNNSVVDLNIYDILGRKVKSVITSKELNTGYYKVQIDFNNESFSSGIYFCILSVYSKSEGKYININKKLVYNK
jgi:photosystem II stability/assembly factor-like uncharacterized protein